MRPTVLIVDDNERFRSSARTMLEAEGFSVVGVAEDGEGAVRAVDALEPDIVLLDIQLPDVDGLTVAERLVDGPHVPAIVLTSSQDAAAYGSRLDRSPARGFIAKAALSGEALAGVVG